MTFTASDVLLKAASRIEEEGMWCQKVWFQTGETPVEDLGEYAYVGDLQPLAEGLNKIDVRVPECAQGAMASAVVELIGIFDRELFDQADDLLYEHLGRTVATWNDERKSAHEVADAMRRAAL